MERQLANGAEENIGYDPVLESFKVLVTLDNDEDPHKYFITIKKPVI